MKYLDAGQTRQLLPYSALADALREVLVARLRGKAYAPVRTAMPLPGGAGDALLLLMPAHDERLAITKLVTVHPHNAEHGLPVVQADVLVLDAATGERLALLDGAVVTARRTAALSLLAARLLAPRPYGPLLIVGSGTQARAHLEAMHEGLGVTEVYITSKNSTHSEALAAHGRTLGLD
ncbi:MAG TPA: delta(1)-pyrroline-2-carboxylate reductase family protein, partial [Chloroflexia bacterium]